MKRAWLAIALILLGAALLSSARTALRARGFHPPVICAGEVGDIDPKST